MVACKKKRQKRLVSVLVVMALAIRFSIVLVYKIVRIMFVFCFVFIDKSRSDYSMDFSIFDNAGWIFCSLPQLRASKCALVGSRFLFYDIRSGVVFDALTIYVISRSATFNRAKEAETFLPQ